MAELGWVLSKDPGKTSKFGLVNDMLGVTVDLSEVANGVVVVANKTSRVNECQEMIAEALVEGLLPQHAA
eukprot:4300919-Amphidinium_carterae.1